MNLPRLEKLNEFPPFLCHALAREKHRRGPARRLPLTELATLAGMSKSEFVRIAVKTSWAGVSNEDTERFTRACGLDIYGRMTKERRFFNQQMQRQKPFAYLLDDGRLRRLNSLCVRWLAAKSLNENT